ncbi:hypothetical protein CRG98_041682, partial [Punica granatum]
ILKIYQSPNSNPSSNVLDKLPDCSPSPETSSTGAARTSNRSDSRSVPKLCTPLHGLGPETGEKEEDTGLENHDLRGKAEAESPETASGGMRSVREETERRMGSDLEPELEPELGMSLWLRRDLRKVTEGERGLNAALCIFRSSKKGGQVVGERRRATATLSRERGGAGKSKTSQLWWRGHGK